MNCPAELRELLIDLTEPHGAPVDTARLAEILRKSPEARQYYLQFMELHAKLELLAESPLEVPSLESLLALDPKFVSRRTTATWRQHAFAAWQTVNQYSAVTLSVSVAMLTISFSLLFMSIAFLPTEYPSTLDASKLTVEIVGDGVTRLVATASAKFAGEPPPLRVDMPADMPIELISGLAEFEFRDGTRVLLEGPAKFTPTSANSMHLRVGRVVARSAAGTNGFTVRTPLATVIDLSTEFGVHVAESGSTQTTVFVGRVGIEPNRKSVTTENEQLQIVTAGKSAALFAESPEEISLVQHPPSEYQRRLPEGERLRIWGTGVGSAFGEADAHWQIVARSSDRQFTARPAIVTMPHASYAIESDTGRWISLAGDCSNIDSECTFTFQTKFDLQGVDISTAKLHGGYAADNRVVAIRLNGRVQPVTNSSTEQFARKYPFVIVEGFVEGENVLEFIVENGPPNTPNPMALLVELRGTALKAFKSTPPTVP